MDELSVIEQTDLVQHESIIERGLKTFVEVGGALLAIRDGKLYRQEWGTFEDYLGDRWPEISEVHAYRLMGAANVVENLKTNQLVSFPATESQARPLTHVDPEDQPFIWQRAVDTAPNGKVTAAHVQRTVNEYKAPIADNTYEELADDLAGNEDGYDWTEKEAAEEAEVIPEPVIVAPLLDSNEWYTPVEFIEAARRVMGSIDLDPASNNEAQQFINAGNYYTKENDGLTQEWAGNVWLNPPYADPLPWVTKLTDSFENGDIDAAILLVNTANSPQWSRLLWHGPYTVCLLNRRVNFWRPDRTDTKGTAQDQMIWYLGRNAEKFSQIFSTYGAIR